MIFSEENKLRILMNENRNLRVIPFVDEAVTGTGFVWSNGSIDKVRIDEVVTNPYDEEQILFRSQCYDDFECGYADYDDGQREEIPYKEIKEAYDKLEWEKVILVFIGTP